ncbi:protein of unknown function [Streptantibioticus cattleyicolor NRRL 8057 = DSM 46488]|nr:protein of unknown function [Streptantibioticus cattleyicolor NRRL 8057 = DSM 46488]
MRSLLEDRTRSWHVCLHLSVADTPQHANDRETWREWPEGRRGALTSPDADIGRAHPGTFGSRTGNERALRRWDSGTPSGTRRTCPRR